MKTSVKNLMMSFALMGCLIIGASDASAQGRGRSQGGSSNRSQSAAVSRTSNSSAASVSRGSSATPQVSRSSSSSSRSASATPQVNRSTPTSSRSTSVAPHAGSSSSTSNRGTIDRNTGSTGKSSTVTTPTSNNRPTTGATTRGIGNGNAQSKSGNVAPRDNKTITSHSTDRTTLNSKGKTAVPDNRPDVTTDKGDKNRGGNMGNDRSGNKDRNGGNIGNDRGGNKDHSGGSMGNDRGRNKDRSGGNRDRNGNHGYSPNNHYDYSNHHYRDQFSWNYSHHSWSRPLPPPARAHRPAPLVWYRPVIPVGWHPYANAPVIDRILGLMFGSLYEASLDHLYYNGYFIDGYADGIIFLRDVPMLNLYWPDVMLNYEYNRFVNAQFVYHSISYDTSRYNRVYRSLSRIYGPPVASDGMTVSWYGGNSTGYVTLSMTGSYGEYYTVMSIGY